MTEFDLVVLGGGLGGVAAVLAAARLGRRSALVSESDWTGGQVSSQCIPPDEHPWIESVGCTRSYREFRDRVRGFYRRNYPLNAAARAARLLNPGSGNIGPLTHEPHVAALVLEEMLAPWISKGLVTVLREREIAGADVIGDTVTAVRVSPANGTDDTETVLTGSYFLDATDLGDLIAAAGAEHVYGADSQDTTGEPHALPGPADPADQQAITWAAVLGWQPDRDNTIVRPAEYERWRSFAPPEWPGPLLSWEVSDHITHRPRLRPLFTSEATDGGLRYDLWHARRVLDDARLPLLGVDESARQRALAEARSLTRSFIYWMQTEAPRHDGGTGYQELAPRPEISGRPNGLAKMAYVRESRRIVADFTLLEQHIGVEARAGLQGAERFADSIGTCAYRIDVHPSTAGRPTVDIDTWPFQIPLGALLPVRLRNLLPAGKNIGATHLTSGAYRVHPGEWTVGEAAGALAAFSVAERLHPRQVRADERRLRDFQRVLTDHLGFELEWPRYEALTPTHRLGYVAVAATADGAAR
jgi:FAD-dependent oxidoreductase family protein